MPTYDYSLCLAIWHHWVRYDGFDTATQLLAEIWRKTTKKVYFETGLAELPDYFNMPDITEDPDGWLLNYLQTTCPSSEVTILGQVPSFPPEQFLSTDTKHESYDYLRNIYCLSKM